MKLGNKLSVSFKENSRTHYVLKYVKFKGGSADVTMAAELFLGRVQDKYQARRSAELLARDGCLVLKSGDVYQLTRKGSDVIVALGRQSAQLRPDSRD
jgi:hypothetical protein